MTFVNSKYKYPRSLLFRILIEFNENVYKILICIL